SGQFPPRAYCLFGSIDFSYPGHVKPDNCFQAGDNITAVNYEMGLKGQPLDYLRFAIALFHTDYKDLPYQVSVTTENGFNTQNLIVDQTSNGVEWESTLLLGSNFLFNVAVGYINVDVDKGSIPEAQAEFVAAPLTPKWTVTLAPEYTVPLSSGGSLLLRADYSFRDAMYGEPTSDPGRYTGIDSRSLVNFDITYKSPDNKWTLSAYGRNAFNEKYDQGRLNTGDYLLVILNNDASEFGLRYTNNF
ncbi:MAG: TonB-dependent receptor domain-containing protein, partial [Lysobacterales bacterium]